MSIYISTKFRVRYSRHKILLKNTDSRA